MRAAHSVISSRNVDVRIGRGFTAAAALLGLAAIGVYLAIALARLTYPFTIEVLESNSLVEVHRILAARPLYAAPSVGYVPDGYPPLYFAVSAAVADVLGQSYANRIAGQRLVAAARSLGGAVAILADPGIAVTAGPPLAEDQVAAADVLRASDQSAKTIFMASLARAVAAQKFSGIITDFYRDLRGFPADLPRHYHRCLQTPLDGVLSVPFSANAKALPVSIWLPIGHGPSCAAVVRTLES